MENNSYFFQNLLADRLKFITEHSFGRNQLWNAYGMRDPSVLIDAYNGSPVIMKQNELWIYANGASLETNGQRGRTSVGLIRYNMKSGQSKALPLFCDGDYCAQGCVIRVSENCLRMYYSSGTDRSFRTAISSDGLTWSTEAILDSFSPETFMISRMGLPFVRFFEGRWIMLFEGLKGGIFHIYMAESQDGLAWEPANEGRPIYLPKLSGWDSFSQANPSCYHEIDAFGKSRFYILYNGCAAKNEWDIGCLGADSLDGPWTGRYTPILSREEVGIMDGRLEGARFCEHGSQKNFFYFATPGSDSYHGAEIFHTMVSQKNAEDGTLRTRININEKLAGRDQYFEIWDTYPIQILQNQRETEIIRQLIDEGQKVLVLGVGGGRELPALIDKSCRITAVDMSPSMIKLGKKRYPGHPINWVCSEVEKFIPDEESFDAVVAVGGIFNYLADPAPLLKLTYKALRLGGRLLLCSFNKQYYNETPRMVLAEGLVRISYTVEEVTTLLKDHALTLEHVEGIRYFVDCLPKEWNKQTLDEKRKNLMTMLITVEKELPELLPPEMAKNLLFVAKK